MQKDAIKNVINDLPLSNDFTEIIYNFILLEKLVQPESGCQILQKVLKILKIAQ
jgi:hypothetical protein